MSSTVLLKKWICERVQNRKQMWLQDHKILINKSHKDWTFKSLNIVSQKEYKLGFQSNEIKVPSGVRQGTHIGSLLANV